MESGAREILTYAAQRQDAVTACERCPERPYVQLRLPEIVGGVKQVTFTTVSHDQGFSGEEDQSRGTYNGCYSYFELAVVNQGNREKISRKLLQLNRHALFEPFTHENVWSRDDADQSRRDWIRSLKGGDTIQIIPMARFMAWRNFVQSAKISVVCEEADDEILISPLARALSGLSDPGRDVYRQLDANTQEIRLIHIAPGLKGNRLRCRMSYASLLDTYTVEYECISYCWGNVQESESIAIIRQDSFSSMEPLSPTQRTRNFPITKNLHAALEHLRYSDRERVLWVDALCINQRDLTERGAQVALMRQIYAKSKNVIIWVGESDQETAAVLRAAVKVGEHFQQDTEHRNIASMHSDPAAIRTYLHRVHAGIKEVYEDWGALDFPLFEREWFRRTWVIQEVFSAHASVLQCGDVVVPWSLILRINMCMHRPASWNTAWRRAVIPDIHLQLFDSNKYTVDPLAREFTNPTKVMLVNILDVLLHGMDLEATDPRDKIFALLGFLDQSSDEQYEDDIRPDYNKSVAQVFADFTRWWIRTYKSLRILSAIHTNAGRTWQDMNVCPDSEEQTPTRPTWSLWHDGRSCWSHAALAAWKTAQYNASADRPVHIHPSPPHILSLEGTILGSIQKISNFPYFSDNPNAELKNVYNILLDPTNVRNIWTSSAFQTGDWDESGQILTIPQAALHDHGYTHLEFLQQNQGAIECHRPCVVTTSQGDEGLCPPMARVGDLVVILFGGRIPYVLRESTIRGANGEMQYEFVGECYLQGYMRGRAMEELASAEHDRSSTVFNLI